MKLQWSYDDEVLGCFAMNEVIEELKLDFKPDTLDPENPEVKQRIIMMLNSIMSEEPAIKAENIKAYARRWDDEKLSEHVTYLYGKWADNEGFVYVENDEIKSIFYEQKVAEDHEAVQTTLYLKANAFYEIVLTKWTELVAERKQQEIYQFLSGEQQLKLQKYFDLLQWTWKSTLLELYSRMTDRHAEFNYTHRQLLPGYN